MGSDRQIVIVATGYIKCLADYVESPRFEEDRPMMVVDRDGTVYGFHTTGNTIAVINAGPLVRDGFTFLPAMRNHQGRYEAIPGAEAVRVPYEFCSCKPYHGCTLYEYMPTAQLASVKMLIKTMLQERGISYPYDNQLGTVSPRAQAGKSGVYFASSFDPKRWDIHPQTELLQIIKALAS
jgi:hypothetical protein